MADFNRLGSPMELCEETLEETTKAIELRKKHLKSRQGTKSPFMIGSINEINKKITRLDNRLQRYSLLVAESRGSDYDDLEVGSPVGKGRQRTDQIEKERREVNQFAGMYCVKSSFTPGLSERARNISKISVNQSKPVPQNKKETGKPKFVELQQYPGYEQTDITPLPEDLPALQILHLVTNASVNLNKKPSYRPVYERLFYSDLSQALLCDLFWYTFLEKFQQSQHSQQRLFNRVSHNFVKLMLFAKEPQYRDSFFKFYPTLLAQAVYASYCEAFPDSYRQFGESFKEYVVCLVSEWMTGTKPAPRSWMKWNLRKLEPENITSREEILNQKSKKSASLSFDFLDNFGGSSNQNLSVYSSNSNLNHSSSLSSMKTHTSKRRGSILTTQPLNRVNFARKSIGSSQQPHAMSTPRAAVEKNTSEKQRGVDPHQLVEALTPIRELINDNGDKKRRKSLPLHTPTNPSKTQLEKEIYKTESHPACKGPDFVRGVFNVQGNCPLVAHFLRMRNLESNSGTILRVQRTELENLPSLDAPTYRDVIKESFKIVTDIAKKHQTLIEKSHKESLAHHRKQRKALRDHMNRESALLSKPREVKRLCDLLILEQKKDQDSVSAGADAAIEAALLVAAE